MIAIACTHEKKMKRGKTPTGSQRWSCKGCKKTWSVKADNTLNGMQSDSDKVFLAMDLLTEGMGVRAVSRITGLKTDTISKALLIVGEKCRKFHEQYVRNVVCEDIQLDELHTIVGCKERNATNTKLTGYVGDAWTALAVERHNKMILAFNTGRRDNEMIQDFLGDLKIATAGEFQISSDGLNLYKYNVPFTFGRGTAYGQIVKQYRSDQIEKRYSPAKIESVEYRAVFGNVDMDRICSSHVERVNLTLRTNLRRFTRLALGFSKSIDHHEAMIAIWVCVYNFRNKHTTIKTTPAMRAGITDKKWSIREIAEFVG